MAPLGQQLACLGFVTAVERVADVGEVVAELTKAEREVKHRHIPHQREQHVEVPERHMDAPRDQRRNDDRDAPDDPGMVVATGIEVATGPAHPARQRIVDDVATRQWLELLDHQREQNGEEAHALR